MAAIAQTIAIVDKSGKVVGTSKQLKNVFKEAKMAYLERRAEIAAERKAREDRELRKAIKAMSVAEETESNISRSHSRRHNLDRRHSSRDHGRRPSAGGRHYSNASVHSGHSSRSSLSGSPRSRDEREQDRRASLGQFNEELGQSRSNPSSPTERRQSTSLVRRQTDLPLATQNSIHRKPVRSHSYTEHDQNVDMDLAYGEYHPESLALDPRVDEKLQKQELSSLVLKCKMLLDEANCAQHSVKAIIAHLQKNPDAMAAVALTLAEISNIASKMAPGALTAFKTSAPAVFAMLAAPEFLIAVGVGVGLTVVMFGGYKIIKKIQNKAKNEKEEGMEEMLELDGLNRIEHWRRGIADTSDTASIATSVEGEFITPMAAASMGHLPLPQETARSSTKSKNKDKSSRSKDKDKDKDGRERRHHRSRRDRDEASEAGSERSHRSSRTERSSVVGGSSGISSKPKVPGSELRADKNKAVIKVPKPSPLRRMFSSKDTNSTAS